MKLRESRQGQADVFHLEGEIDLHYVPALRSLFQAKTAARCRILVVDLSGVAFIDSTGISVLIEYLLDAAEFGGRICLAAPSEHVRDVFEIVQLGKALPIFDSVAEACAAFSSGRLPNFSAPLFEAGRNGPSVAHA
jgi:anti-anti-sigma factor